MKAASLVGAALGSVVIASCGAQSDAPPSRPRRTRTPSRPEAPGRAQPPRRAWAPTRARRADGSVPGVVPLHGSGSPIKTKATPQCNSPKVSYFGGPILESPVIVAVFWSSGVNALLTAATTGIGQFFTDVTQSTYWSWLHEYDTVGLTPGTNQAFLPGTLRRHRHPHARRSCAAGTRELHRQRRADPDRAHARIRSASGLRCRPPPSTVRATWSTIYMIELPAQRQSDRPRTALETSCVDGGFCAYHNTGTYGAAKTSLIYGVLMDEFTAALRDRLRVQRRLGARELDQRPPRTSSSRPSPTRTSGSTCCRAVSPRRPSAWGDNNNQCGEIGDICDDGGTGDTITVSGRTWSVQEVWSNKQNKCTSSGHASSRRLLGDDAHQLPQVLVRGRRQRLHGGHRRSARPRPAPTMLFGGCEQCTASDNTCAGGGGTCQQFDDPRAGRHLREHLHADHHLPGGRQLRHHLQRLRRHRHLRQRHLHLAPDLRRRRNGEQPEPVRRGLHRPRPPALPARTAAPPPTAAAAPSPAAPAPPPRPAAAAASAEPVWRRHLRALHVTCPAGATTAAPSPTAAAARSTAAPAPRRRPAAAAASPTSAAATPRPPAPPARSAGRPPTAAAA